VARERAGLAHWGTIEHGRAWDEQFAADTGSWPAEEEVRAIARISRNTCTPDVAGKLCEIWWETDVRGVLPTVQVPTLLMVGEGEGSKNPEVAEYVASLMPQAEVKVIPPVRGQVGTDGVGVGGFPSGRDELERYVRPRMDTILSTVLFTDIVASTEHQARLGDHAWKELVERHHATVRAALGGWRGVENDTAGDGFYATFDGPARAIHCAHEVRDRVRDLGVEIRAGVHTGECEVIDGKCAGIAVTTGSRIASLAEPSQVLVSQTVKDLVAGSGFGFEPAGEHKLKGVPDRWRLYAAT
jgi:class 3 adenylate cyclase